MVSVCVCIAYGGRRTILLNFIYDSTCSTISTSISLNLFYFESAFIEAHNSKQPPPSYTLGHNHFSDMTLDEYQEYNKLGHYSPGRMTPSRVRSFESVATATKLRKSRRMSDVPDSVDWVDRGAIVPVKNQGE